MDAAAFTEEHRSTLDWLNKITDETFRFFGLEEELWKIGNSLAAPKFNIISKPNNWSHSVAKAAQAIDEAEYSEIRLMQREYWAEFDRALIAAGGPVAGGKKPQLQSWMAYPVGRAGFMISAVMIRPRKQVRAEVYITGSDAKAYFALLERDRKAIEQELGYELEWDRMPDRQDCRIAIYRSDADPEDRRDWQAQHQWLAVKLNELHRAFSNRIRGLDLSDLHLGELEQDVPTKGRQQPDGVERG